MALINAGAMAEWTMIRSVDMQIWPDYSIIRKQKPQRSLGPHINKGSCQYFPHGHLDIRICTYDGAIFPSELHQTGLEILSACLCNLPAGSCAAREIYFSDCWVLDHGIYDVWGVLGSTTYDVETSWWQTCVGKCAADCPVTAWGKIG